MIKLPATRSAAALKRAAAQRPRIQWISRRAVRITNQKKGTAYTVRYSRVNDAVFAKCGCAAGRFGVPCWHSVIGAYYLAAIAKLRRDQ
jgi:hypothetical protein